MNIPATGFGNRLSPTGSGLEVAAPIFIRLPDRGVDGISGSLETDAVHNFSNEVTDQARLVFCTFGPSGVGLLFVFIPFHSSEIAHASQ